MNAPIENAAPVANPTAPASDANPNPREITFRYRSSGKETVKVVKDGVEQEVVQAIPPRAPEVVTIKFPTAQEILATGSEAAKRLLQDAIDAIVIDQCRDLLDEPGTSAATIDHNKLAWEFIAAIPPAERRGNGIPKQTWEDFALDYLAIMPAVTNKAQAKIEAQLKLISERFRSVKFNKAVLSIMEQSLTLYMTNSPNAEKYVECLDALMKKLQEFLSLTEEAATANI
jgi:aspartyl/asparaginyl-tRNA synthetase